MLTLKRLAVREGRHSPGRKRGWYCFLLCWMLPLPCFALDDDQAIPKRQADFLRSHCLDCHGEDSQEGAIDLQRTKIDWDQPTSQRLWERVLGALKRGEMPPPDAAQPSENDRRTMIDWIDATLTKHTPVGGTIARRLNQMEYQSTIQALFGLKQFQLPAGFPADREIHGFDNLGEGLVLSPPQLLAYAETASSVADQIFSPPTPEAKSVIERASADELVLSYSCGKVIDGAFRLGMKCDPIQRSCTWPSRIEAKVSGCYSFTIKLSQFRPKPGRGPNARESVCSRCFQCR